MDKSDQHTAWSLSSKHGLMNQFVGAVGLHSCARLCRPKNKLGAAMVTFLFGV